jgi:hypothetical protein
MGGEKMIEQNESALDRRLVQAYKAATGVILADPSLIPEIQPWAASCPSPGLRSILEAAIGLYNDEDADIDAGAVMIELGDNPVREHVPALEDFARQSDHSPRELLDSCLASLASCAHEAKKGHLHYVKSLRHFAGDNAEEQGLTPEEYLKCQLTLAVSSAGLCEVVAHQVDVVASEMLDGEDPKDAPEVTALLNGVADALAALLPLCLTGVWYGGAPGGDGE